MDFTALVNKVNILTQFVNNVIANSLQIWQLPNPTDGDKFVAVWNEAAQVTEKLNLSSALAAFYASDSRITTYGTVDRVDDTFTYTGFAWRINGLNYSNASPIDRTIPLAETDFNRIDIAVADAENNIRIITGFESETVAEAPAVEPDTLLVTTFVITDSAVVVAETGSPFQVIWNEGDPMTFEMPAGFVMKTVNVDRVPLNPNERSQEGNVVTIVGFDLFDGQTIAFFN